MEVNKSSVLDLKKAFDTDCLLYKWSCIRVVDIQLKLFDSCLRNRKQIISHMGAISDKMAMWASEI